MFWNHTINSHTVHFDNTPFAVTSVRKLDCQFDHHYYKEHHGKSDRVRLQGSEKLVARPTSLFVLSFCIQISSFLNWRLLCTRKVKEVKAEKLKMLHKSLQSGSCTTTKYIRIIISIKQEDSRLFSANTPKFNRKIFWISIRRDYWYTGSETSVETLHDTCSLYSTKTWQGIQCTFQLPQTYEITSTKHNKPVNYQN